MFENAREVSWQGWLAAGECELGGMKGGGETGWTRRAAVIGGAAESLCLERDRRLAIGCDAGELGVERLVARGCGGGV